MFQNPYEISANQEIGVMGKRLEGKVIAHKMDDQNGLIKIRIKGLHDGWPEDCIPWQQAEQGYGAGNNQSGKVGQIPPIGATTYSRFLSDNQYHPVYTAGPSSDDKKVDDFTNKDVYPYAYGSVDQGGHKEVINTKEGQESYTRSHVKGSNFGMDKDGNINHSSAAALNQTGKNVNVSAAEALMLAGQSGHIKVAGKLIIEAAGGIEFRGTAKSTTPITVGAPGPTAPTAPTLPSAGKRPSFSNDNSSSGSSSGAASA